MGGIGDIALRWLRLSLPLVALPLFFFDAWPEDAGPGSGADRSINVPRSDQRSGLAGTDSGGEHGIVPAVLDMPSVPAAIDEDEGAPSRADRREDDGAPSRADRQEGDELGGKVEETGPPESREPEPAKDPSPAPAQ